MYMPLNVLTEVDELACLIYYMTWTVYICGVIESVETNTIHQYYNIPDCYSIHIRCQMSSTKKYLICLTAYVYDHAIACVEYLNTSV